MTTTPNDPTFARTIAAAAVTSLFPEELPFFDELATQPPVQKLESSGDSPLGFGLHEAVQLFTPIVIAVATSIASSVVSEATDALKEELGTRIKAGIRQVLDPKDPAKTLALSQEQLSRVHEQSLRQLESFGVEPATATKIADALIGSIVVGN